MGLPVIDISMSNKPIAFIITPANRLEIVKIKLIQGGFFTVKPYGVFHIDASKVIPYKKQACYFFDSRNANPLDVKVLEELEYFSKKNTLHQIKRKDVGHAEKLRRLFSKGKKPQTEKELKDLEIQVHEQILTEVNQEKDKITQEVETVNEALQKENDKLMAEGKPVNEIDPELYTSYVVEHLHNKRLITSTDATEIKMRMIKGEITISELLTELLKQKDFLVHEPITVNAQKYLDDFGTYDPSLVDSFIDRADGLGKKIEKMGSPEVKNFGNLAIILPIIFGVMIVAIILGSADFNNMGQLKDLIPFLP